MRRALAAAVIILAALSVSLRNTYDPDLFWHLAQGREDTAGRLVRTNTFSFNYPEYRQHYTTWLFDIIAYTAFGLGGGTALQLIEALLVALTLWLVLAACRTRAPATATAAVLVVGFFVLEPRVLPRPYLASFAGLAFCTLLIERACASRSSAPLRWAVPAVAVWSNFHVECLFGVALLGLFALAELAGPSALSRRDAVRAAMIAALCAAATLLNPYGAGLLRYLHENISVPQILDIAELRPPYLPAYRAFFGYLAIAGVLALSDPRSITLREVAIAIPFAVIGFRYLRLTPLAFIATAPMVADMLGRLIARGIDRRVVVATALAAGISFSRVPIRTLATGLHAGSGAIVPPAFFSARAIDFARAHGLRGPVFNSNNLGGYLAWTMYPEAQIFQDGRLQAYPPEHFRTILNAAGSEAAWVRLVSAVDWAVLSSPRPYSLSGIGEFPGDQWAIVFWDDAVQVLARRTGRYTELARTNEYEFVTPEAAPLALVAQLASDRGARIRAEAKRNRTENPDGFTAAVVTCLTGDEASCARVDRFEAERPSLRDVVKVVREIREGRM